MEPLKNIRDNFIGSERVLKILIIFLDGLIWNNLDLKDLKGVFLVL